VYLQTEAAKPPVTHAELYTRTDALEGDAKKRIVVEAETATHLTELVKRLETLEAVPAPVVFDAKAELQELQEKLSTLEQRVLQIPTPEKISMPDFDAFAAKEEVASLKKDVAALQERTAKWGDE
jgi:predicted  nucleic acid-binding Zn-ribbon protein